MQRFFNNARPENRDNAAVTILQNAFEAASTYKRAIAVMYDLSGLRADGEDCSAIIEDWKYLVDELKVTDQSGAKTYLQHNGKRTDERLDGKAWVCTLQVWGAE